MWWATEDKSECDDLRRDTHQMRGVRGPHHVYNWSLWLDLRILVMTPLAALLDRGAS
jgi:lipopolysaccharide/colanic/teichoic acid biosynthesis glycosyltransferase